MAADASTPTSRRILVEAAQNISHIRTLEHGSVPLANPGMFVAGVYRGVIHSNGTATLTWESR